MQVDPASLDKLNDFVAPEPVGFWPVAPVVVFLFSLICVWAFAWGWTFVRRYIDNAYRREAIAELVRIRATGNLAALNALLKRTAMTAYGRESVASLYGPQWLDFLATHYRPAHDLDLLGIASSLKDPAPAESSEQDHLFEYGREWIRHHRVEESPC